MKNASVRSSGATGDPYRHADGSVAWYEPVARDRVERRSGKTAFSSRLNEIAAFEKALADDGAIILKFFLYLDAKSQRKRLKALNKNPLTRWRVTEREWRALKSHQRVTAVAAEAIRRTSTNAAPWHIVEGVDTHYRNFMVGTLIHDALREGMDRAARSRPRGTAIRRSRRTPTKAGTTGQAAVLASLDMTHSIEKKLFRYTLEKQQGRLNELERHAREREISTVAVFEGWDAAGKGGALVSSSDGNVENSGICWSVNIRSIGVNESILERASSGRGVPGTTTGGRVAVLDSAIVLNSPPTKSV